MLTGNSATYSGGAIYCTASSPLITNCTVADNILTNVNPDVITKGGGFYITSNSTPIIVNGIFWDNAAKTGPEIYVNSASTPQVRYSRVKGGMAGISVTGATPVWENNEDIEDPGFVGGGDYRLASDSPCIDKGTKEVELSEFDFEGDPRILGSAPDIGADEIELEYEVKIDVRPGSRHNKIDLRAWGFLPVAVLSTDDFDATSIDPKTVELAGAAPMHWIRAHVKRDGKRDMLFFFWIRHLDFGQDEANLEKPVTTEVTLTGKSSVKGPIIGRDTVTIINPKHKRHWWSKFEQMSEKKGNCKSK
jgi:hypothetical protein